MESIGLVPRRVHYELRQERNDLVFITYKSVMSWSIEGSEVPKRPKSLAYFSFFDEAISHLSKLLPIFSRFYSSLTLVDLSLRDLAMQSIALAEALRSKSVKVIFMGTASSHHLETQILEIAARIVDIPQIFEYYLPDTVDILPIMQTQGVTTRTVLPYRYEYQFESNFLQLLKSGWKAPRDISVHDSRWYRFSYNYRISQWYLYLGSLIKSRGANGDYERRNDYLLKHIGLNEDLKLLKVQRESLKTLLGFETEDRGEVEQLVKLKPEKNPIFCVYAQFQPEATTFPEGGEIANHIDLVAKIRSFGYTEPILYLEHPSTRGFSQGIKSHRVGVSRRNSYYENLKELGCLFVDRKTFEDLPPHIIPVTMTGSIGLERSILGIHTVVSGIPWYAGIPGTLTLQDSFSRQTDLATRFDPQVAHDFLNDLIQLRTYPSAPLLRGPHAFPEIRRWKQMYHFLLDQSLQVAN